MSILRASANRDGGARCPCLRLFADRLTPQDCASKSVCISGFGNASDLLLFDTVCGHDMDLNNHFDMPCVHGMHRLWRPCKWCFAAELAAMLAVCSVCYSCFLDRHLQWVGIWLVQWLALMKQAVMLSAAATLYRCAAIYYLHHESFCVVMLTCSSETRMPIKAVRSATMQAALSYECRHSFHLLTLQKYNSR